MRIGKLASEIKVPVLELVEFINSIGIEYSVNPNIKLSDELVYLIKERFKLECINALEVNKLPLSNAETIESKRNCIKNLLYNEDFFTISINSDTKTIINQTLFLNSKTNGVKKLSEILCKLNIKNSIVFNFDYPLESNLVLYYDTPIESIKYICNIFYLFYPNNNIKVYFIKTNQLNEKVLFNLSRINLKQLEKFSNISRPYELNEIQTLLCPTVISANDEKKDFTYIVGRDKNCLDTFFNYERIEIITPKQTIGVVSRNHFPKGIVYLDGIPIPEFILYDLINNENVDEIYEYCGIDDLYLTDIERIILLYTLEPNFTQNDWEYLFETYHNFQSIYKYRHE